MTTRPHLPTDDATRGRLSALIAESGLSIAEFARVVVARDERTVRRWLAGEMPIPDAVSAWLARLELSVTRNRVVLVVAR